MMNSLSRLTSPAEECLRREQTLRLAHDIRSSLKALQFLFQEDRFDRKMATRIVEDLQDMSIRTLKEMPLSESFFSPSIALKEVIEERRGVLPGEVEMFMAPGTRSLMAGGERVAFKRIISNLFDNALEAMIGRKEARLDVSLHRDGGRLKVTIKDNGRGVAPVVLDRLGREKFTTKVQGHGLGIFSAKDQLNKWDGEIEIFSALGVGTSVVVDLNLHEFWKSDYVFIEDDPFFRKVWWATAQELAISLSVFSSVDEFLNKSACFSRETIFFLDSYLSDGKRGEIEAGRLVENGFGSIFLSTANTTLATEASHQWIKGIKEKNPPWFQYYHQFKKSA